MAGLKKPSKRDKSNPSTVLIIFLVFFVLLSIGLGVWGYYGYAGQEELRKVAATEKKNTEAMNLKADFAMTVARDARAAIGPPLDANEYQLYVSSIGDVMADGGRFGGKIAAEDLAAGKKFVNDNRTVLGFTDEKKYKITYKDELDRLKTEVNQANGELARKDAAYKALTKSFNDLKTAIEKSDASAAKSIDDVNKNALDARKDQIKQLEEAFARNKDLSDQIKTDFDKAETERGKYEEKIKLLDREIKKMKAQMADVGAPVKLLGDVHALLLDISKGKTLWDHPLGKITRIELEKNEVFINIGSRLGAKPELTFNVFASGWKGLAEKDLKATIEVIRVLDASTSLCKITSLYDADGREIVMADTNKGRSQRESENALKEGDLLFNMFFGSRVALAGNFSLNGVPAETPAEQMRNLSAFMTLLQNNGVKVDAYLDLTDNSIKGEINHRTRYLILGDKIGDDKPAPAPKPKENGEPKEGEGKEGDPKEVPPAGEKTTNAVMTALRKEAADRGMFIISADNFLNVIGYRRPRSANDTSANSFRPSAIRAGQGLGVNTNPDRKGDDLK